VSESTKLNVAFFGFAKANSFAEATWGGVQAYVKGHNATATFIDSDFDGQAQAAAMQDATTSGRYKVYVLQANDGGALVEPVKQAIAAGITVIVEFTPVGSNYATIQPQVPGSITLIDTPVGNGDALGQLAISACKSKNLSPCQVAYLQGFANYPLDGARTAAVTATLKSDPSIKLVASVVGGYTADTGRSAMQDVLQAHPGVNVVIGSSQAIEGADTLPNTSKILWIGNGGSTQAVDAVKSGKWYATYDDPEHTAGELATALGLARARGATVPVANSERLLAPGGGLGTKSVLADVIGQYSD
jgi:ribose transport system substrate-binding protein